MYIQSAGLGLFVTVTTVIHECGDKVSIDVHMFSCGFGTNVIYADINYQMQELNGSTVFTVSAISHTHCLVYVI